MAGFPGGSSLTSSSAARATSGGSLNSDFIFKGSKPSTMQKFVQYGTFAAVAYLLYKEVF